MEPEELRLRAGQAYRVLQQCTLCGHQCQVDRLKGDTGVCQAGKDVCISSYGAHFGEESPLVGRQGSGTIFFTHCNLKCVYCQNYEISWYGYGNKISLTHLADIMLSLQDQGCHNINLVSPTHYVPQIIAALYLARKKGLTLPIVYNTGGYDSLSTLQLLDGIIDIYMPDVKYMDSSTSESYSGAADYPLVACRALKEMQRQVGDLKLNHQGIAWRGLLIRHLVLPEDKANTDAWLKYISREVSPNAFLNIMGQYRPAFRAANFPPLARPPTFRERQRAINAAKAQGLRVYT